MNKKHYLAYQLHIIKPFSNETQYCNFKSFLQINLELHILIYYCEFSTHANLN